MQKPTGFPFLGTAGILLSGLVAIAAGIVGFSRLPLDRPDFAWVAIYTLLTAGLGFLLYRRKYQLLNGIVLGVSGLLLLIIFAFSDNGPAILAWLWLFLISAGLGNLFWNLLKLGGENDLLDRLFIGTALGIGALAVLMFGLGAANVFAEKLGLPARFFRLYHPIPVFGLLILLTAVVLPGLYRTWKRWLSAKQAQVKPWLKQRQFEVSVFLVVFFLCFAAAFIWALSPTIRFDSLVYHLAAPETYLENRGIVEVTEPMHFYLSHYAEMIFTLGLIVTGQPLPALMHLLSGIVTLGLTFLIAFRLGLPKVGWLAVLLFVTLPIFYDAGTVHNDFFVAMFSVASFCSILGWWQDRKRGWLVIAGVLAGLSIGTKVNAAVPALAGGLAILFGLVYRRANWKQAVLDLASYGLPLLLLYLPWAALNALWTGNPVYPFFCSFFTCPKVAGDSSIMRPNSFIPVFISRFLLLPFTITLFGDRFYIENFGGIAAGVFLFSLPWIFVFRNVDEKLRKTWIWLAVFSVANFLFMIPFAHRLRYALPVVPILCILAAINLLILWEQIQTAKKRELVLLSTLVISGLYLISTRLVVTSSGWQFAERYPYQVALGLETPEAFLSRAMPPYDALQFLTQEGNGKHKVAAFGVEARMYSKADVHTTYYSAEIMDILNGSANLEDLARLLKKDGYNYVLYDQAAFADADYTFSDTRLVEEPFLSRYARLVFARNDVYLYRLFWQEDPQVPPAGVNRLVNGDFEETETSGQLAGWSQYSEPTITTDGSLAHSGKAALQASNQGYVYQRIDVEPDRLYTLGFWSRSDVPDHLVRLQILWLDNEMQPVQVTIKKLGAQSQWTWNQLSYSAPKGAVLAQVFVTTDDDRPAWFDDICFTEGPDCK